MSQGFWQNVTAIGARRKERTRPLLPRLSFDFQSREQVGEFVTLEGPEPSVFIPTLQNVTLGELVELDLGLTGQRQRYQLQARAKWSRRGGSGPRLLPGVSLACDAVAALTLQQLSRDAQYHSFLFTRADPRFPCAANVRVHLRGPSRGGHPIAAHLGDISRGGAFVVLANLPNVAREPEAPPLQLELAMDQPNEELRPLVSCHVRWLGFLNGERGFGCSFLDPDERVKVEVGRLLQIAAGAPAPR